MCNCGKRQKPVTSTAVAAARRQQEAADRSPGNTPPAGDGTGAADTPTAGGEVSVGGRKR